MLWRRSPCLPLPFLIPEAQTLCVWAALAPSSTTIMGPDSLGEPALTSSGSLLTVHFTDHGRVHMKKIEDKTVKRWCKAKKHLFHGARCAPCAALLETKRPYRPKRADEASSIQLTATIINRWWTHTCICANCGAPTYFSLCLMSFCKKGKQ